MPLSSASHVPYRRAPGSHPYNTPFTQGPGMGERYAWTANPGADGVRVLRERPNPSEMSRFVVPRPPGVAEASYYAPEIDQFYTNVSRERPAVCFSSGFGVLLGMLCCLAVSCWGLCGFWVAVAVTVTMTNTLSVPTREVVVRARDLRASLVSVWVGGQGAGLFCWLWEGARVWMRTDDGFLVRL